jgi:hypothetical protein
MMKTNQILSVMGIVLAGILGGCGQNVDPLDLNGIPQLNSITAQTGALNSYVQGTYTASNPYWVFNTSFAGFAGSYVAPAQGIVSEIGVANLAGIQGYFITILSGRISTRIYGIQQPTIRVGDYVFSGQNIAVFYASSAVGFQVMLDGTPVCPLSYLSTQFRASLYSYNSSQLCQ